MEESTTRHQVGNVELGLSGAPSSSRLLPIAAATGPSPNRADKEVGKSASFTVFHPSDSIQRVGAIVFKLAAVNSKAAKLDLLLRGTKTAS